MLSKITVNYLVAKCNMGNAYTPLNDTSNQIIPEDCQEYNDTHKCISNKGSNYCIYYIQCMICCTLFIWLWCTCSCKSNIRVILIKTNITNLWKKKRIKRNYDRKQKLRIKCLAVTITFGTIIYTIKWI